MRSGQSQRGQRFGDDDQDLRDRIRGLIATKKLVWPAGAGLITAATVGATCEVCGEVIKRDQKQLSFQTSETRHVHQECFIVWIQELDGRAPAPSAR